jgi:hypothetical protein
MLDGPNSEDPEFWDEMAMTAKDVGQQSRIVLGHVGTKVEQWHRGW